MAWRLAKGLIKLRDQINEKWPLRSKVSDGSIGDLAHAARKSDHNPDAQGVVHAIDITKDDVNGPNLSLLAQALTTDPRTKYIIYEARIWKARTGQWSAYTGINAHRHHLHVSIKADLADDEHTWALDVNLPPESYPVLKFGAHGLAVRVAQEKLRDKGYSLAVDGVYGKISESVVRQFQLRANLPSTGIIDGITWTAILAP